MASVFLTMKGLNLLDQIAPEGARDSANEWLSLTLYDGSVFTGWRRLKSTRFSLGLNCLVFSKP